MQHKDIIKVGIIGGGEFGQALGRAFYRSNVTVEFYDKQDDRSTIATIKELVDQHEVILLCVPSWANREVIKEISKTLPKDNSKVVLSFSKGVSEHFTTMDQVLSSELEGKCIYGLAYGPMVAEEIAVGRQASSLVSVSSAECQDALSDLFRKAKVTLDFTNDMRGLAICGVLKNIYAIAFGMNDGMHLGDNAKGKLAVMVLSEMKQLLAKMQTDPLLAEGLAGLGDLITTGITDSSFNYRVGKTIAEGIADESIKSEGLNTLKELSRKLDISHYPLLNALNRMVYHYENTTELEKILLT